MAGPGRSKNEDMILCGGARSFLSMDSPMMVTDPGPLAAVADGMGGGPGGALAAERVLSALSRLGNRPRDLLEAKGRLETSLFGAAESLSAQARGAPELSGMGAAVAGLWLGDGKATVFNCGDCRVYRCRQGVMDYLTRDHSAVYDLYLEGHVKRSELREHPLRSLITRAVQEGNISSLEVFAREVTLRRGDVFLICSDGLWEALDEDEIEESLAASDLAVSAWGLLDALADVGLADDCSFVLLGDIELEGQG
jgi:serine/threonine protein phosphatase PrpC